MRSVLVVEGEAAGGDGEVVEVRVVSEVADAEEDEGVVEGGGEEDGEGSAPSALESGAGSAPAASSSATASKRTTYCPVSVKSSRAKPAKLLRGLADRQREKGRRGEISVSQAPSPASE